MEIRKLSDLFENLKEGKKRTVVVANAIDDHTVGAVSRAVDMGIVDAILVGDKDKIEAACRLENFDPSRVEIVHVDENGNPAMRAVELIHEGRGELLMKGLVSTDVFMRAILNKEKGLLPPKAVLSHITVVENPMYHKLLVSTDVAVIPLPDLNQKIAMANYLIRTAKCLGVEKPKVAVIAATEQVLSGMQACLDAAILSKMGERGQIKGGIIDGPMALDVAVDHESAEIKGVTSPVAGDADCLLFPSIEAANVYYKMCTKLCKTHQAAFVAGAKVPCILASRGDSIEAKLNSIALSAFIG
ncbi:MAG: phosphate acyltransferase [Bacteroidota bacterium]|nr:phosphate acyltransferase [Bacteroidota bacterium]MDP4206228.1 phosphate acyltransferase [Bacteroidota bacterium]